MSIVQELLLRLPWQRLDRSFPILFQNHKYHGKPSDFFQMSYSINPDDRSSKNEFRPHEPSRAVCQLKLCRKWPWWFHFHFGFSRRELYPFQGIFWCLLNPGRWLSRSFYQLSHKLDNDSLSKIHLHQALSQECFCTRFWTWNPQLSLCFLLWLWRYPDRMKLSSHRFGFAHTSVMRLPWRCFRPHGEYRTIYLHLPAILDHNKFQIRVLSRRHHLSSLRGRISNPTVLQLLDSISLFQHSYREGSLKFQKRYSWREMDSFSLKGKVFHNLAHYRMLWWVDRFYLFSHHTWKTWQNLWEGNRS